MLLCRPPVPVPRLLKEGVSEAQAKDYAAKATVHINKGLCECRAGRQLPVLWPFCFWRPLLAV